MAAANKRFVFKIKTKSGGIVGNIVIDAKDIEAAKVKLRKRYPDCEINDEHSATWCTPPATSAMSNGS